MKENIQNENQTLKTLSELKKEFSKKEKESKPSFEILTKEQILKNKGNKIENSYVDFNNKIKVKIP
ncbi:Uncharacterised protein [Chlamydia abortus]|nr:Uncharacterised protein [Chlamydia abortus]SGA31894.1 Uncharacterised protein [Chlamydia abortus]SGA33002.1 Uncharacterised protein [Chlamydia abortus]